MGIDEAKKLRENFADWVRIDHDSGLVRLEIRQDYALDVWSGSGKTTKDNLKFTVKIAKTGDLIHPKITPSPMRHIWGGKSGWFSASYGPFRRFTGGMSIIKNCFILRLYWLGICLFLVKILL